MPETMDERAFRNIARMNPNALNPDGTLKSLLEQYGEVMMRREADPTYRVAGPYVLAPDIDFLGIRQALGKPLVFSAGSLKHVVRKHGAAVEVLSRLPEELEQCILGYVNPDSADKLTFVLDAKSENGNDIISVLRTDLNMSSVDVVSIRSVHGKERDRLIANMGEAMNLGREFFLGEKTGAWLEIQGHIPDTSGVAEEILKRLQDALYTCDIPANGSRGLVSVKPSDLGEPLDLTPRPAGDEEEPAMELADVYDKLEDAIGLEEPNESLAEALSIESPDGVKDLIATQMERLTPSEAEERFPDVFATAGLLDDDEPVFHREWSGCSEFLTCAAAGSGYEWQATLITPDGSETMTAFSLEDAYETLRDMEDEHWQTRIDTQGLLLQEDIASVLALPASERASALSQGDFGPRAGLVREAVNLTMGKEQPAPSKPAVPGKSPGASASARGRSFESSLEAAQMSARAQAARMGLANPTRQQGAR